MTKMKKDKDAETKEVATSSPALTPAERSNLFDTRDNLEGVKPKLPQIGIVHQAQLYSMPDGDNDKVKEFEGIIIDMNPANAWWEEPYAKSGGGSPPQCFSLDGITPSPMGDKIQGNSCSEKGDCPQARWGSKIDDKGNPARGKACKNMKRVHIIMEGKLFPYRLTIPPSGLDAIDTYVCTVVNTGTVYQLVRTHFSLKETKNKDGITYSEPVLKIIDNITDREQAFKLRGFLDQWKDIMRGEMITADEARDE